MASLESSHALPPLRCATAGSVDDGKSTLIGRLLYDAKALYTDQLAHLSDVSQRRGLSQRDLALVTDGLRAEREQGITIDVAWRYFATGVRRFILADSPGHVQYTRNMVTAASHADVAIVLVDAARGITEQTRRHLFIARLLGVRGITVAVNKMDQVGYSLEVFSALRDVVATYLGGIDVPRAPYELTFIPLSALEGDNVVHASTAMRWYDGPTLLSHLERAPVDYERSLALGRMFVQGVIRRQPDFRGVTGRIASGFFRPGEEVRVLPSGEPLVVRSVETADGPIGEGAPGMSVTLRFTTEVDVGRGDLVLASGDGRDAPPTVSRDLVADVAWMHKTRATAGATYLLKLGTREVRATIEAFLASYDVAAGRELPRASQELGLNELGRVQIRTAEPVAFDAYAVSRATGSFLLIDPASGDTLAGGMARA